MFGPFEQQPGLLYVVATLLPLAAFALLLLAGMVRMAVRARRDDSPLCASIYDALGGDTPRKWPAFVATGAIGLAFVCSLIGFIAFQQTEHERHEFHHEIEHHQHDIAKIGVELKALGSGVGHGHPKFEIEQTQDELEELGPQIAKLTAKAKTGKAAKDRKSTRLNSSHLGISYAVFCLK